MLCIILMFTTFESITALEKYSSPKFVLTKLMGHRAIDSSHGKNENGHKLS